MQITSKLISAGVLAMALAACGGQQQQAAQQGAASAASDAPVAVEK